MQQQPQQLSSLQARLRSTIGIPGGPHAQGSSMMRQHSSSSLQPPVAQNPFNRPAPNAHPSFGRHVMSVGPAGQLNESLTRTLKPPKPPDKPCTPYMRYSKKVWERVKAQNPDQKMWDIGKAIGLMWRELPDAERQIYHQEYEAEKADYDVLMKQYHNSLAYQQYLQAKAKQQAADRSRASVGGAQTAESGVFIQPVEEDEGLDSQFSFRHVAAARYQRNHRLMIDVFGDTVVPDIRNVVTTQRLNLLKRQVDSLTNHQKKLEQELETLEEKFQEKKRKIEDSGQKFLDMLSQVKKMAADKPVLDEPTFQAMIDKHAQQLKDSYRQVLVRQQQQRQTALPQPMTPVIQPTNGISPAATVDTPPLEKLTALTDQVEDISPPDGTKSNSECDNDSVRDSATDDGGSNLEAPTQE